VADRAPESFFVPLYVNPSLPHTYVV